jgi:hypothetical protein
MKVSCYLTFGSLNLDNGVFSFMLIQNNPASPYPLATVAPLVTPSGSTSVTLPQVPADQFRGGARFPLNNSTGDKIVETASNAIASSTELLLRRLFFRITTLEEENKLLKLSAEQVLEQLVDPTSVTANSFHRSKKNVLQQSTIRATAYNSIANLLKLPVFGKATKLEVHIPEHDLVVNLYRNPKRAPVLAALCPIKMTVAHNDTATVEEMKLYSNGTLKRRKIPVNGSLARQTRPKRFFVF